MKAYKYREDQNALFVFELNIEVIAGYLAFSSICGVLRIIEIIMP